MGVVHGRYGIGLTMNKTLYIVGIWNDDMRLSISSSIWCEFIIFCYDNDILTMDEYKRGIQCEMEIDIERANKLSECLAEYLFDNAITFIIDPADEDNALFNFIHDIQIFLSKAGGCVIGT